MDRSRIFRFSEMLYLCSFLLANKLTAFSAMGNDTAHWYLVSNVGVYNWEKGWPVFIVYLHTSCDTQFDVFH